MSPVIVTSTRFGTLDIPDERAIDFGPGLLGFPESQRYVLVEIEDDDDYFWIQSVEIDDVSFLCIRPWDFFPDYELDVSDDVQEQIELHDPVDSEVYRGARRSSSSRHQGATKRHRAPRRSGRRDQGRQRGRLKGLDRQAQGSASPASSRLSDQARASTLAPPFGKPPRPKR